MAGRTPCLSINGAHRGSYDHSKPRQGPFQVIHLRPNLLRHHEKPARRGYELAGERCLSRTPSQSPPPPDEARHAMLEYIMNLLSFE